MDAESPVKQWLQRHSPVKRRDKPLPIPPCSQSALSYSDRALQPTSANISPSKHQADSANNPKARLRSFLSKDHLKADAHAPPPRHPKKVQRSPHGIRKALHRRRETRDLRTLADKVHKLEDQLRDTKREIKNFSTNTSRQTSRRPSRPTSVEREQLLDAERLRRQLTAAKEDQYDVLAEHLLTQSYRDRNGNYQPLAWKSTDDLSRAAAEQADLEADEDPEDADDTTYDTLKRVPNGARPLPDPASFGTQRSKLRRHSEANIQSHPITERYPDHKRRQTSVPDSHYASTDNKPSKRSRRASSFDEFAHARDKELPLIQGSPAPTLEEDNKTPATKTKGSLRRLSAPSSSIKPSRRKRKSLPNPPMEILSVPRLSPPTSKDDPGDSDSSSNQPRKSNHRRRQSQVISRTEVDEALGEQSPARPMTRGKQGDAASGSAARTSSSSNWTVHAPSANDSPASSPRRSARSPSRLDRVEEEFEWDEEVF